MTKNFRKPLALLVVFAIIALLAACGNGGGSGGGNADTGGGGSTGGPAAAPETSGDTETLRIGLLLNLTGWFAANDLQAHYESSSIVDIFNSQGGWDIGGKKYMIELVESDLQSDFGNVNAAAMYLIDQDIDFVILTLDFFVAGAASLFEENGVMTVCMMTTMQEGFPGPDYPHAFVAGLNGVVGQVEYAAQNIAERFPDVKSIVYCENDTGTNQLIWDKILPGAQKNGLELIPEMVLYSGETTDLSSTALQLVNSGADAVITQGAPDNVGAIIKEVRNLGSDMPIGMMSIISPEIITMMVGQDNAYSICNLFYSMAPEDNIDIYNQTVEKCRETFGEDSLSGYTSVWPNSIYVLLNMMSVAGSTDVDAVMDAWQSSSTCPTIFGPGTVGGTESYGIANHAVAAPTSFMLMDKEGVHYFPRVETIIP